MGDRPEPGTVEERSLGELTVEGRKLRGVIPYGQPSKDLGGWTEVIEARALAVDRLQRHGPDDQPQRRGAAGATRAR